MWHIYATGVKMSCLYIFAAFKHPEVVVKEKRCLGLCPITASVVTRDKFATKTAVHLCKYETYVVKVASTLQIFRIFAGQGSYCFPRLHAWEAARHPICVVAHGNNSYAYKKKA